MKSILTPTDFSESTTNAMEYAAYLSKKTGATIHIVTVIDSTDEDVYTDTEEKLKALNLLPFFKGFELKTYIKIGDNICDKILECADDVNSDIIVMGSGGTSSVGEMFIGSNAEKVVINSDYSVLTIKHQLMDFKLKSIVFASDFSNESANIFPLVKEFADLFDATIHLLKIITPNNFETTKESNIKIKKFIENQRLDVLLNDRFKISTYNDTNEEVGIMNYCIENEVELIALGTHGRRGIWKIMHDSTSQNLVNHSFRPVLTIKIKE